MNNSTILRLITILASKIGQVADPEAFPLPDNLNDFSGDIFTQMDTEGIVYPADALNAFKRGVHDGLTRRHPSTPEPPANQYVLLSLVPTDQQLQTPASEQKHYDPIRLGWRASIAGQHDTDTISLPPTRILYQLYPPANTQTKYQFSDDDWISHFLPYLLDARPEARYFQVIHSTQNERPIHVR